MSALDLRGKLDDMSDISTQIKNIAQQLSPLCLHISIREDERGLYILAIAEDDIHSLELWHHKGELLLELWHGQTAEVECVVDDCKFADVASALERAKAWLLSESI